MSKPDFSKPHYKAHPDDEGWDRIEIVATPRWKSSGLSGDEWRVGATVRFYRKGQQVGEKFVTRMEWACMMLPSFWIDRPELSSVALWGLDAHTCHQFGCDKEAAIEVRLKQQFSARGEGPLPDEKLPWDERRAFCLEHQHRGDAGREDSDDNYERVTKVGA